ncbi:MAG: hypothetical protein WDA00_03590 [Eubacteriales bacterium]
MSKKPRKKKEYDDDDGRTIANMNVEGMPWYQKRAHDDTPADPQSPAGEGAGDAGADNQPITLTKTEGRAMMRGVLLAAFLVGAVFFGAIALFILFCIYVWFR